MAVRSTYTRLAPVPRAVAVRIKVRESSSSASTPSAREAASRSSSGSSSPAVTALPIQTRGATAPRDFSSPSWFSTRLVSMLFIRKLKYM